MKTAGTSFADQILKLALLVITFLGFWLVVSFSL